MSVALAATLPLLGATATGCTVSTDATPTTVVAATDPIGVLVVDWTIELTRDPADCQIAGVASIQIQIVTTTGLDAGFFEQACTAFSTSITLTPGTYSATAVLVDSAGTPRTTSVDIAPFTLFGNDEFRTPIDFPVTSFY